MDRIARHPTLQCSRLLYAFLTSTEWNVQMHSHLAHPPGPDGSSTLLENMTDTLMNAFSRVRKPDERFLEVRDHVDKFEEGLVASERGWNRVNTKTMGEPTRCAGLARLLIPSAICRSIVRLSRLRNIRSGIRSFGIWNHGTPQPILKHLTGVLRHSET